MEEPVLEEVVEDTANNEDDEESYDVNDALQAVQREFSSDPNWDRSLSLDVDDSLLRMFWHGHDLESLMQAEGLCSEDLNMLGF